MGKTNQPLTLWVHYKWRTNPLIVDLTVKNHTVVVMESPVADEPDIILHPAAHYWTDEMWDTNLLETAMMRARVSKKVKKND